MSTVRVSPRLYLSSSDLRRSHQQYHAPAKRPALCSTDVAVCWYQISIADTGSVPMSCTPSPVLRRAFVANPRY
eukprot:1793138-Rhodomonas_salina.2